MQIEKTPLHLGIIMDGNRRWAAKKILPVFEGHRRGANKIEEVSQWCLERGIEFLTLYAFSTENWNRPSSEVNYIINLGKWLFPKKINRAHEKGIKIRVIGEKERLGIKIQNIIQRAENLTRNNDKLVLTLAISYGGRAEILEGVRKIVREGVKSEDITEQTFRQRLWTAELPDVDLMIRTSGEERSSGFLMWGSWGSAYSEFYVCHKYWPDFSEKDLDEALTEYAKRRRRFGK